MTLKSWWAIMFLLVALVCFEKTQGTYSSRFLAAIFWPSWAVSSIVGATIVGAQQHITFWDTEKSKPKVTP